MTGAHNSGARAHYEEGFAEGTLLQKLSSFLESIQDDERGRQQLAALDHFHARGAAASAELAQMAQVGEGEVVLDAGSGLGGPSRFLARRYGCAVTGIDLMPDFVEVATYLAEREGLSGRVGYEVADLTALPFREKTFDLIWSEHVLMNVADRDVAYREFQRVLRPAGRAAFYEPVAIAGREVVFPVPWARSAATSSLLSAQETIAALERSGFGDIVWRDVSEQALVAFDALAASQAALPLSLVMGPRFAEMASNFARSVRENRIGLGMFVARLKAPR